MSLFNFSKTKDPKPEMHDLVWINQNERLKGSWLLLLQHPGAVLLSWFNQTKEEYEKYFVENGITQEIKIAGLPGLHLTPEQTVIFLEHYPLRSKEEALIKDWNVKQIIFLNALDEPLFQQFGSERIIQMMKALGIKEGEFLEHSLISKSIENAQHKLEKKITFESHANSAKEWFAKNMNTAY
jgi:hypothetical protein